jgi:DNA-binding CsgD family transcriptional regulator
LVNTGVTLRHSWLAVVGSACFWASGYLAFLSPSLFLGTFPGSVNSEFAYFASQAAAALLFLAALRWMGRADRQLSSWVIVVAAVLLAVTMAGIAVCTLYAPHNHLGMIIAGSLNGLCFPVLAVAWAARYTWESGRMATVIALAFLLAFLLYFLVSNLLPPNLRTAVTIALPLISIALWLADLQGRRRLAPELGFSGRDTIGVRISEVTAGDTSLRTLPWRTLLVLGIAAFIGDLVSSLLMGFGYEGAGIITNAGFAFGAGFIVLLAAMWRFVPRPAAIGQVYRFMLPLVTFGLLCILVLGEQGRAISIGVLRGTGLLFQVLVFVLIAQASRRDGLSPLLSFGAGIAILSGLVFLGNVLGKLLILSIGDSVLVIRAAVAITIIVLVLVLSAMPQRAATGADGATGADETRGDQPQGDSYGLGKRPPVGISPADTTNIPALATPAILSLSSTTNHLVAVDDEGDWEGILSRRAQLFGASHGLTERECEVLAQLVRGRSNSNIAAQLYVTSGTVKTHLAHIYRKLGVNGRQETIEALDCYEEAV